MGTLSALAGELPYQGQLETAALGEEEKFQ